MLAKMKELGLVEHPGKRSSVRPALATASTRTASTTACSAASGVSAGYTRIAAALRISAGSGRCIPPASQEPYASQTKWPRWKRRRPSSGRAGSEQARNPTHLKPSGHAGNGEGRVRGELVRISLILRCWNLSFIHQLRRLGGNRIPGDRQMLLYAQAWLPLVTITLAAAILFGVASFMMTHAKP
jgi:hypothetical protein